MKVRTQPPPLFPQAAGGSGGRFCRFGRLWLKLRARRHKSRRGRPCNLGKQRTCRMAPPPVANNRSLFLSTLDGNGECLIYSVHLESVPPADGSGEPPALEIRPSADPVTRWSEDEQKYSAFAAVSGGTIVALVARSRRTVIRDTATGADAPGPLLRRPKRHPAMLPVGDDTVLVMNTDVRPGRCCFEALRRVAGGEWRAEHFPDPPFDDWGADVTAYFARGSRAWISLEGCGTFSLDVELGTWRMEGTWELRPLEERGLFVPELGLVFGIAGGLKRTDPSTCIFHMCAIDVEARPRPVVRRVWEFAREGVEVFDGMSTTVSLAHLGNGRFFISRSIAVQVPIPGNEERTWKQRATSFTVADVTLLPGGDLKLAKLGKSSTHVWPYSYCGHAMFLQ